MRKSFAVIVCMAIFFFRFAYADEYNDQNGYVLGEGLALTSLPIYIGGYVSLDYYNREDYSHYRLDDIAFLSYGTYRQFSYMAEFEYKEFYVVSDEDGSRDTYSDTKLHTERLYVDYAFNDAVTVRAGKYNSYIGYWNLVPINVLRETTSNPATSSIIFPKFTTGVEIQYKNFETGLIGISATLQNNKDLDDEYNNYKIDKHYGASIEYENDAFGIKFNGGYFRLYRMRQDRYYGLLSLKYETDDYQILSEIGTQYGKTDFTTRYAAYVQGLYRLTQRHILITRFESFDEKLIDTQVNKTIIGYTYRPLYPVAIKGEYQFSSLSNANALLFSLSVLF